MPQDQACGFGVPVDVMLKRCLVPSLSTWVQSLRHIFFPLVFYIKNFFSFEYNSAASCFLDYRGICGDFLYVNFVLVFTLFCYAHLYLVCHTPSPDQSLSPFTPAGSPPFPFVFFKGFSVYLSFCNIYKCLGNQVSFFIWLCLLCL